jgi:uncharacterized phage protein (TIGR02218 family)
MKSVSANLAAHAAGEALTMCTCWKVTRADGLIFGFTDHNLPLSISGVTYKALTGHTASSVESTADLSVDNLEVTSFLDDASITELDLLAGVWNHAVVEIFRVNYLALADGTMSVRKGHLGEVRVRGKGAIAELRGLAQVLQQTIGEVYSPSCRADLFDTRCKLVAATYTVTGSLTGITSNAVFADSARSEANGWFNGGKITWNTGSNSPLSMEIKTFTSATKTFELMLPMLRSVQSGDTYSALPGCLKRFTTDCTSKYNNAVNFRGEPHVPGLDAIIKRPT